MRICVGSIYWAAWTIITEHPMGGCGIFNLKKTVMKTFCKKLNSLNKQSNSFPLNFLNSQLKHKRVCLLPTRQVVMWTLHYIALIMNRTKCEVNILSVLTSHHEIQFRKLFAVLNIHNPITTHQSRLSRIYF